VPRPESLDHKALATAFLRARELLLSPEPLPVEEVRRVEEALRPVASAWEIQQVVVPMLDRAELYGLAMAWDSGIDAKPEDWLRARVGRWLLLGAPEFGFVALCELVRMHAPCEDVKQAALSGLASEREPRSKLFETNLAAIAEVDAELSRNIARAHRSSVGLRPLGAGLAEFGGQGQPWVQLWAVTPNDALLEAERLALQCGAFEHGFIAGVGDCSLPIVAARIMSRLRGQIHIVELHLARVRALLELADLSGPLRDRRLRLHAGTRALATLAPIAENALTHADSVVGGDALSISIIRAAAGRDA
jgi:hypothetical protein